MPPPGATSFLIVFVLFDIIEFLSIGRDVIAGAAAGGATTFLAMILFGGMILGGAIFEPVVACVFTAVIFFGDDFFNAARTGFADFLEVVTAREAFGFAAVFLAGAFAALPTIAPLLEGDTFFAGVLVRFAGGAERFAWVDLFAFAIGYFDFLSLKFLPAKAVKLLYTSGIFKMDVSKQPCPRKNPPNAGYSKIYDDLRIIGQIRLF
jgi:hypothetical protein